MPLTQTHRHWVALPAFGLMAAVLAGTSYAAMGRTSVNVAQVQAQLVGQATDSRERMVSEGQDVLFVSPDTSVRHREGEGWELAAGPVLIGSHADFAVTVGDAWLRGLNGSAYITRKGDMLTIAALSTPVTVLQDGILTVVPVSYQWVWTVGTELSSGTFRPSPTDFVYQQGRRMAAVLPTPAVTESKGLALPDVSFLMLPAARERQEQEETAAKVAAVFAALEEGSAAQAADIVHADGFAAAVQRLPDHATLVSVMASASAEHDSSLLPVLLPLLWQDRPDLWMLAALHPAYAATTWIIPVPSVVTDDVLHQALLAFPQADTLAQAFPEVSVRKWQDVLLQAATSFGDTSSFIHNALPTAVSVLERVRTLGYPERFERYRAAFLAMVAQAPDLTPADATLAVTIKQMEASVVPPPSASVASQESVVSLPPPLAPADAEQAVRALLQGAEAGITVETTVVPQEDGTVTVTAVLFASPSGDALFDFVIDTRTNEVHDIAKKGERQSIPLSWEKFVGWAKGE